MARGRKLPGRIQRGVPLPKREAREAIPKVTRRHEQAVTTIRSRLGAVISALNDIYQDVTSPEIYKPNPSGREWMLADDPIGGKLPPLPVKVLPGRRYLPVFSVVDAMKEQARKLPPIIEQAKGLYVLDKDSIKALDEEMKASDAKIRRAKDPSSREFKEAVVDQEVLVMELTLTEQYHVNLKEAIWAMEEGYKYLLGLSDFIIPHWVSQMMDKRVKNPNPRAIKRSVSIQNWEDWRSEWKKVRREAKRPVIKEALAKAHGLPIRAVSAPERKPVLNFWKQLALGLRGVINLLKTGWVYLYEIQASVYKGELPQFVFISEKDYKTIKGGDEVKKLALLTKWMRQYQPKANKNNTVYQFIYTGMAEVRLDEKEAARIGKATTKRKSWEEVLIIHPDPKLVLEEERAKEAERLERGYVTLPGGRMVKPAPRVENPSTVNRMHKDWLMFKKIQLMG